ILGIVGAFLVYLVRRAAREPEAAGRQTPPQPMAAPGIVDNVVPATLAFPEPEMPSPPPVLRKKRKQAPVAVVTASAVPTPIVRPRYSSHGPVLMTLYVTRSAPLWMATVLPALSLAHA